MRAALALSVLAIATIAPAAPPPPPPDFVGAAADLLIAPAGRDRSREDALFAADVSVYENGTITGRSLGDFRRLRTTERLDGSSRVLAYGEGWGRAGDAGELLVFDTFDTVDRAGLPPTFLADPRMATRSILYQFGADHLIHTVRIARVDGFVMIPRAAPAAR